MIDDDSTAAVKVDSVSDDWVGCCISQYSFICNELDIQLGYVGLFFIFLAERPREFLIDQLEQLKLSKVSSSVDSPCLFSNANLEAIFGILDPIDHGSSFTAKKQPKSNGHNISAPECELNISAKGLWLNCSLHYL